MNEKNQKNEDPNDNPGVIMPPPLILLGFLVAGAGLEFLAPLSLLPPFRPGSPMFIGGLGIIVLAIGLALWAIRTFSRAGTNIPTHKAALGVVSEGPYRFTRNPMYMGMQILLIGVGVMFSSEWHIISWPLFFMILKYGVVLREERYMEKKFGDEYRELLERTRRWI